MYHVFQFSRYLLRFIVRDDANKSAQLGCPRFSQPNPPTQPKTKTETSSKAGAWKEGKKQSALAYRFLWNPKEDIVYGANNHPPFRCSVHIPSLDLLNPVFCWVPEAPFHRQVAKVVDWKHLLGWWTWIPFGTSGGCHHQNYPPGNDHMGPLPFGMFDSMSCFLGARWDRLVP